jgi:adenylate cyclase class 2
MDTEFEATFTEINKTDLREKLKQVGAELIKPEFLQKRTVFYFPEGHELEGGWIRVRDEGDRITMSVKTTSGATIADQKELCLVVDSFSTAINFLTLLGCKQKSFQENKREIWHIDECEVCIDEWPFLEPLVEIEGATEDTVISASSKLGFDYKDAFFGNTGFLLAKKYGISEIRVNNETPELIFGMENPFTD